MFKDRSLQVKMVNDKKAPLEPEEVAFIDKTVLVTDSVNQVVNTIATNVAKGVALYVVADTLRKVSIALVSK